MTAVTLRWGSGVQELSLIQLSVLDYLDGDGFYAILGASREESDSFTESFMMDSKLLFIGHAFGQRLRDRISQDAEAAGKVNAFLYDNPGYEPMVMVGAVAQSDEKLDKALFEEIEACLVRSNRPVCNPQGGDAKPGRSLTVTNTGDFDPLLESTG